MARLVDKIVGHDKQKRWLAQAYERGRLPSTWVLVGPAGVGKKLFAEAAAQALICEAAAAPCGECSLCRAIEAGQSDSVLQVGPDGVQIKIDQARGILDFLSLRRLRRARVVLIDDAHLMNAQAANALLKIMEEPPENSYFILVVPTLTGLLPTVRSRAQVLRFGALRPEELQQVVVAEPWVLEAAQGRTDLAQQLMELGTLRSVTLHAWEVFASAGPAAAFQAIKDHLGDLETSLMVTRLSQQVFRDAFFVALNFADKDLIHRDQRSLPAELATRGEAWIGRSVESLFRLERELLGFAERSLAFESLFYSLAEEDGYGSSH